MDLADLVVSIRDAYSVRPIGTVLGVLGLMMFCLDGWEDVCSMIESGVDFASYSVCIKTRISLSSSFYSN